MSALLPLAIENYISQHTSDEGQTLQALERKTHTDILMPQMLSGKVQGRFLSIISKIMRPKRILEIGTFTGYSALCLAEGLASDGLLITIDVNEELEDIVQTFLNRSGLKDKVTCMTGKAEEIIPQLNETFDMVFIDADKVNYNRYFDLIIDKVRSGGLILADNVLWSGKIVEDKTDKDTRALQHFNEKVQSDTRVENVILSIRDGIMLMYKK